MRQTLIYFSGNNKLPARFPGDVVRVKRSTLRTVNGVAFERKASQKMKSLFRRLRYFFSRDLPDSDIKRLRGYQVALITVF